MTFERTLQTSSEDHSCAHRIARLRSYYFRHAPELTDYLLSVPPEKRLAVQGLATGPWQGLLTIPGMVAVITSVLVGATAGMLVAVISNHSLAASLAAGGVIATATLLALWRRGQSERKRLADLEQLSPYARCPTRSKEARTGKALVDLHGRSACERDQPAAATRPTPLSVAPQPNRSTSRLTTAIAPEHVSHAPSADASSSPCARSRPRLAGFL